MSKHTPGPWFPTKIADYNEVARIGRAWNISTMLALADLGDVDADARLIAAAPELLEALRIAREIVVTERDAAHQGVVNPSTGVIDDSDDADWVAGYDRALEQIDSAIAKATGEKA